MQSLKVQTRALVKPRGLAGSAGKLGGWGEWLEKKITIKQKTP
jgi:hypothetical protein